MIIPINQQYRIATDPYQWTIQKKRTRCGEEEWRAETYHPTFESALQSLGELLFRQSDAETLTDALEAMKTVTTQLSQALTIDISELTDSSQGRRLNG